MRLWVYNAQRRACGLLSLLAFLCLGFTGATSAVDSPPPPFAQDPGIEPPSETVWMVQYWPAHCTELERAQTSDAIHCWWFAAEEISRYAAEGLVFIEDARALRTQWLWRGARLSLQASRPVEPDPPSVESSSPVKTVTPPRTKAKPAGATVRKPKSAGVRKLRKNKAVAKPAALHADAAAFPLVEPTMRTSRKNRFGSGFPRRKSRNSAQDADWYR